MPGANTNPLSDAELVSRLALTEDVGAQEAAGQLGISASALRTSLANARSKGLTSSTVIIDELEKMKAQNKMLKGNVVRLERQVAAMDEARRTMDGLFEASPEPPAWLAKKPASGLPGVPMTIWSDWHWGEVVNSQEVGGVNSFTRHIGKQRVTRLIDTIISLTKHHTVNPKYPGIVVCLGGDMITGNIHEELRDTNDGYLQQSLLEVQEQLCMALTVMADEFGKVWVPCVVGNHGRGSIKPRMKGRVYDSFEWNLYRQLALYFRGDKRVQFFIPAETDAYFTVLGHRFLLTHGDSLGVKGGDGIIGAIGPIARGAFKVGRSEGQIGRDFDTLLMGHYHTYVPRGDAAPVIVNGSLIGYGEYSRLGLRVPYSRPSQALWFVHDRIGITAQWQVFLDEKRKAPKAEQSWSPFQERAA